MESLFPRDSMPRPGCQNHVPSDCRLAATEQVAVATSSVIFPTVPNLLADCSSRTSDHKYQSGGSLSETTTRQQVTGGVFWPLTRSDLQSAVDHNRREERVESRILFSSPTGKWCLAWGLAVPNTASETRVPPASPTPLYSACHAS